MSATHLMQRKITLESQIVTVSSSSINSRTSITTMRLKIDSIVPQTSTMTTRRPTIAPIMCSKRNVPLRLFHRRRRPPRPRLIHSPSSIDRRRRRSARRIDRAKFHRLTRSTRKTFAMHTATLPIFTKSSRHRRKTTKVSTLTLTRSVTRDDRRVRWICMSCRRHWKTTRIRCDRRWVRISRLSRCRNRWRKIRATLI